jgi:hypothetical protein
MYLLINVRELPEWIIYMCIRILINQLMRLGNVTGCKNFFEILKVGELAKIT